MDNSMRVMRSACDAKIPDAVMNKSMIYNLYAMERGAILPHSSRRIKTGVSITMSKNICGIICSQNKSNIQIFSQIIDQNNTSEIILSAYNMDNDVYVYRKHEPIAHLIIYEPLDVSIDVIEPTDLSA